jgi:hypothetical protein
MDFDAMRGAMERALRHDTEQRDKEITEIANHPHHFSVGEVQTAMKHLAERDARQRSLLRRVLPILMTHYSEHLYGEPWVHNLDKRLPLESRVVHNIAISLGEIPTSIFPPNWRPYPDTNDSKA